VVEEYSLFGLFLSAFLSSTLLPGGSEVVLIYLVSEGWHNLYLLWIVASLGNTLGGMTSWLLGRWLIYRYPDKILNERNHTLALKRLKKWGPWALLFSWLPIVGDPLCLIAGWLKIPILISLLCILVGKSLRYGVILWVF